jgi:hypothetical protein
LFSTSSPFYWDMERAYQLHSDVLAERAARKLADEEATKAEGQVSAHEEFHGTTTVVYDV